MSVRALELEDEEEEAIVSEELDEDIEETLDEDSLAGIESDDVISLYMKEVGTIPLLTADEERDLALALKEGEAAKARLARSELSGDLKQRLERKVDEGDRARARFI
ncbi:MAG: sigma-70 factor domain-containing protein, partial [Anaerolineae bacterium]